MVGCTTGDSEAIVCQVSGASVTGVKLSKSHKPSDPSEAARIRNLGGEVLPPLRPCSFQSPQPCKAEQIRAQYIFP